MAIATPFFNLVQTFNFLIMNVIQKKFRPSIANCILRSDETPVQGGLSYTPADMREMMKKGYPVAPQSLSDDFFQDTDNKAGNNFDVEIWEKRGVSINDAWEHQQDARKKIRDIHASGAFELVNTDPQND